MYIFLNFFLFNYYILFFSTCIVANFFSEAIVSFFIYRKLKNLYQNINLSIFVFF